MLLQVVGQTAAKEAAEPRSLTRSFMRAKPAGKRAARTPFLAALTSGDGVKMAAARSLRPILTGPSLGSVPCSARSSPRRGETLRSQLGPITSERSCPRAAHKPRVRVDHGRSWALGVNSEKPVFPGSFVIRSSPWFPLQMGLIGYYI